MQDKNLVLALSSKERRKRVATNEIEFDHFLEETYQEWLERKPLLKEEQMEEILAYKQLSKAEFARSIAPIEEIEVPSLYKTLTEQSWYHLHREILANVQEIREEEEFDVFLRPYKKWLEEKIVKLVKPLNYKVGEEARKEIITSFSTELLTIALKTLVYDLYERSNENEVIAKKRQKYFETYFKMREGYQLFFNDYPVLARLLATRTEFFAKNLELFFNSLDELTEKELSAFSIQQPFNLNTVAMDKGDSHEQGKSVILMTINGKQLVFKYKDLTIANRFDRFCQSIEQMDARFSFYYSKRLVKTHYTIEEFIDYFPCNNKEEIATFYQRFGHLVALTYFLNGSDFHLENLIAAGSYPVLIDIETIIQNVGNTERKKKAVNRYIANYHDSVIGTCLLPRNQRKENKNIELSALSGDEQPLPEKVLQLVESDDGNLRMEYQAGIMAGSNNLPLLNDKKVNFTDYQAEIIIGFSEMYHFFLANKERVLELVEQLFEDVLVRNVLKATQKYAEMLNYGYHPSYMTNYLNREKLFENLWVFPYRSKKVIKAEIEDLLVNDVPIFYNQTDSKELIYSDHHKLTDFYEQTALELVTEKITKANQQTFQEQLNYVELALGKYQGENVDVRLSSECPIQDIDRFVQEQLLWGADKQDLFIENYKFDANENWFKEGMNFNFYDGYTGLYSFYDVIPNKTEKQLAILAALEDMLPKKYREIKTKEHYASYFSILYLFTRKIKRTNDSSDKKQVLKLLETIEAYYQNSHWTNEWLFGRASLLQLCVTLYQVMPTEEVYRLIQQLIADIQFKKMDNVGFAHGYAGVIYAFVSVAELFPRNQEVNKKLQLFVQELIKIDFNNISQQSWCNGLTGIAFTLTKLRKNSDFKDSVTDASYEKVISRIITDLYKDSDGLCHGNAGILAYLNTIKEDQSLSDGLREQVKQTRKKLNNRLSKSCYIQGMAAAPSVDLMNGLAGIGYELLRSENSEISNVLVLE
ncbi:type 2 lanthipeptide synthetase LanM [Enterococcus sp. LJL99]